MSIEPSRSGSRSFTVAIGIMAALLVIIIVLFPDAAFKSSLQGLTLWWKLVFPALMPFLILTELLIGFGALQGLGVLLEPLMRICFRIPGIGGWALASGLLVGFPAGAKITASLREKKLLNRYEAERLVSMSHFCNPLLLVTIVGVGFLQQAKLGLLLAIIHYVSAFLTGILLKRRKQAPTSLEIPLQENLVSEQRVRSLWIRAIHTMREAYLHDGRAFGKLLGDAVTASVQTLMMIGGYMMIYAVFIHVLSFSGVTAGLGLIVNSLLDFMGTGVDMISPLLKGLFEVHLGTYSMSQVKGVPLIWQLSLISALLGWGGLCAHAQVSGITQKTDIRYMPFLLARGLHALIAGILTALLGHPFQLVFHFVEPSFLQIQTDEISNSVTMAPMVMSFQGWIYWQPLLLAWICILTLMIVMSIILLLHHKKPKLH